ncbi:MAG: hypothetical protein GX410_11160 [Elusimicrobia bacterium]|nr:hypothetical protein [Elusimicrobiota bacterium]
MEQDINEPDRLCCYGHADDWYLYQPKSAAEPTTGEAEPQEWEQRFDSAFPAHLVVVEKHPDYGPCSNVARTVSKHADIKDFIRAEIEAAEKRGAKVIADRVLVICRNMGSSSPRRAELEKAVSNEHNPHREGGHGN